METSIVEALLLPWWKILLYIVITTIGIITIRITVKFDINTWLQERKEAKALEDRDKASRKCQHLWTLYTHSPYSRCDKCLVLISTSILNFAREHSNTKPLISGIANGIVMTPGKNEIVIDNYIGARD